MPEAILSSEVVISHLTHDVMRIPCERVLMSPDLHNACCDRINQLNDDVHQERLYPEPPKVGDIFVRGVPAHRSTDLNCMEYALVPKVRDA